MGSGSICKPGRVEVCFPSSVEEAYPKTVLCGRQGSICYHEDMITAREIDVEQEPNEMAVVVLTEAVVHPWTVMI